MKFAPVLVEFPHGFIGLERVLVDREIWLAGYGWSMWSYF
jgi:hypothetical protein